MLAEMTWSNGNGSSGGVGEYPFLSLALYSSDLTASSPRTAYWAERTCWFMLLTLRLRRGVEEDIVRREICPKDGKEGPWAVELD